MFCVTDDPEVEGLETLQLGAAMMFLGETCLSGLSGEDGVAFSSSRFHHRYLSLHRSPTKCIFWWTYIMDTGNMI